MKERIVPYAFIVAFVIIGGLTMYVQDLRSSVASLENTVLANRDTCWRYAPSKLAIRYLNNLYGVEIGASTQNSFGLQRAINVDIFDESGADKWQDPSCKPATVHILSSGDNLPFKDASLDYVLSSHVIEHFFDPIKALREWHRVIKPGGYIFVIAPHKDRTFDRPLPVTPLSEHIDRNTGKIKLTDYAKPLPESVVSSRDLRKPTRHTLLDGEPLEGWTRYTEDDHHHWSVWKTEDFIELVKYLGYKIIETHDRDDKLGNGFTVVIRK